MSPQQVTPVTPGSQVGTEVPGETLVQGDTLPRTGAAAIPMLLLTGGLGVAFGMTLLKLASRKRTPVQSI